MHDDLSVLDVARLVGVSRARVYQRCIDPAAQNSRPLSSMQVLSNSVRGGMTRRIPIAAALAWRNERLASGDPVGPLPDWLAVRRSEPVEPLAVVASVVVEPDPPAVGLPVFRPF
jgi:hypothetical protein